MDVVLFGELCDRLEKLVAGGRRLSVVAAVCETGADPKTVQLAFDHLEARGAAKLEGGIHRGRVLVRKRGG